MIESVPPHACELMKICLDDVRVPIEYVPRFREYHVELRDGSALQELYYCPFCGAGLPESLRDAWFDQLDDLGLEPEDVPSASPLSSDRWWRALSLD